jgi:soluble lytic murein transglycosylase-like protein
MGAIAKVESNCNPDALGDDNRSLGLFQVQMGTARLLGFKGTRKELLNPKINYAYARIYMEHLKKKYKGNLCRVLYVYNSGDYAALKYKTFCDKIYPRKIFKAIKDGDICEIKKITGREI